MQLRARLVLIGIASWGLVCASALAQTPAAVQEPCTPGTPAEKCIAKSADTIPDKAAKPPVADKQSPPKKKSLPKKKLVPSAKKETGAQTKVAPAANDAISKPVTRSVPPGQRASPTPVAEPLLEPECFRPDPPPSCGPTPLPATPSGPGGTPTEATRAQPGTTLTLDKPPLDDPVDALLNDAGLPASKTAVGGDQPSGSRAELFGLADPDATKPQEGVGLRGFFEFAPAYTYADPSHWSRGVARLQVGSQGRFGENSKWKLNVRADADPVLASSNFYPDAVKHDMKYDVWLRETYIDTSAGPFELRLGKQQIVWGEMVGLFFADVVSAKDMRDFILPEFEIMRIPQWAARAEYFGEKSHFELIWLPYPEVDRIGKPGSEFYPFQVPPPPGFAQTFNDEEKPDRGLRNTNGGFRMSTLRSGWDLSAFYFRSYDASPTFYRELIPGPTPTLVFTPRHDRIWQAGGTMAKDFRATVLKAEVIYTSGRKYDVTRLSEPTGVVAQDTVDYVIGLDYTFTNETRINLQYFERVFFQHDPDLLPDRREGGVTILLSGKLTSRLKPELLIIQSVNRDDRLLRPKLIWEMAQNWRLTTGVDVFTGPVTGFFGRFSDRDRVYSELHFSF